MSTGASNGVDSQTPAEFERYLIFSQNGPLNPALLVADKQRLLGVPIQVDLDAIRRPPLVRITCETQAPYWLTWRAALELDWQAAELAEHSGRAAGMATLARRCPLIWDLSAPARPSATFWRLCAALAALSLGPILPPDRLTLYGIRSALARAARVDAEQKGN